MSEFISSFLAASETINTMKIYTHFSTEAWAIHIIPTIDLYFETKQPLAHKKPWKGGLSGIYLQTTWLKWSFTIGTYKTLK